MMSGVPLETYWAFNKLWNNKFYYKLHLVGISTESYYNARIHEYQIRCLLHNYYQVSRKLQNMHNFQGNTSERDPEFKRRLEISFK